MNTLTHLVKWSKVSRAWAVYHYVNRSHIKGCTPLYIIHTTYFSTKHAAEKMAKISTEHINTTPCYNDPGYNKFTSRDIWDREVIPKLDLVKAHIRFKEDNIVAQLALLLLGK